MIEGLKAKLPLITQWIDDQLLKSSSHAKSIKSFGFKRLPQYYSDRVLCSAKSVVVNELPIPPLVALGLTRPEFANFAQGNYSAITYKNTYFIRSEGALNESIHFHELVHVVQWDHLGVENFLLAYAIGLLQSGYRNSPLEAMAYTHTARFDRGTEPYDVEKGVRADLEIFSNQRLNE
jgi:hypothetical protein